MSKGLKYIDKVSYDKFNQRRVVCLQCGFRFMTTETFERELETPKQSDLFKQNVNR